MRNSFLVIQVLVLCLAKSVWGQATDAELDVDHAIINPWAGPPTTATLQTYWTISAWTNFGNPPSTIETWVDTDVSTVGLGLITLAPGHYKSLWAKSHWLYAYGQYDTNMAPLNRNGVARLFAATTDPATGLYSSYLLASWNWAYFWGSTNASTNPPSQITNNITIVITNNPGNSTNTIIAPPGSQGSNNVPGTGGTNIGVSFDASGIIKAVNDVDTDLKAFKVKNHEDMDSLTNIVSGGLFKVDTNLTAGFNGVTNWLYRLLTNGESMETNIFNMRTNLFGIGTNLFGIGTNIQGIGTNIQGIASNIAILVTRTNGEGMLTNANDIRDEAARQGADAIAAQRDIRDSLAGFTQPYSPQGFDASFWQITALGRTFNLSPFQGGMGEVFSMTHYVVDWLCYLLFVMALLPVFFNAIKDANQSLQMQAPNIDVAGFSVGTTLAPVWLVIAMLAITAVPVGLLVLLGNSTASYAVNHLNVNPFAGWSYALGQGIAVAFALLPIGTMVSLAAAYAFIYAQARILYQTAAFIIRFCVGA